MARYVVIWFRYLKTDRMIIRQPDLREVPFALAAKQRGRMVITASSKMAIATGITEGMVVADARSVLPGLQVMEEHNDIAAQLLTALATSCLRFTPTVAIDLPDGLILDISGCAHLWGGEPAFYSINFDDLTRSNRCNPLDPESMTDITDASESARTILLGLNHQWQTKQGDFFVESAINFVTAVIWFLRCYQDGIYCTLAHVIELMQVDYGDLFTILRTEKTIGALINPFITAFKNNAMEQLEGQVGSAKIAMARLASPQLYYVLTGNDFTLDINNPKAPKVVCFGNNPQKIQTYGAVISLYLNRLLKLVNQKNKKKSMVLLGEFGTIVADVIPTIVTGRSNKVAVVLELQDIAQLRLEYGKEKADVIVNTVGNLISGQVVGDSAKQISERIGKIMQDRESLSVNGNDTSINHSKQLEYAVPASTISSLSSGEFVGMVADTPQQKIKNKAFHNEIAPDFDKVNAEERVFKEIPVVRRVTRDMVERNYEHIRQDIANVVAIAISELIDDPTY